MHRCIARILTRTFAGLALVGLGACGLADGGADPADGGPSGPGCRMRGAVSPSLPSAPVTMELQASIDIESAGLSGLYTYEWSVSFEDAAQELAPLDVDGARVAFLAGAPGVYELTLSGAVGSTACASWLTAVNVADPGAEAQLYRLRLIPPGGQALPIQEIARPLVTDTDVALGTLLISPGVEVNGTVETEARAPLRAYLRVSPRGAAVPWFVEGFAGQDGGFSLRLENARYDVLVVPLEPGHAPITLLDQVATPPWRLVVPASPVLAGRVVDHEDLPIAGAQVSVGSSDGPAVPVTTGEDGAFAVPVRAGSALRITVVPPAGTGLPWLELPEEIALSPGDGPVTIVYAAGRDVVAIEAVAHDAGGALLPGARASWVAQPVDAAGSLIPDGQSPIALSGTARVTAIADGDGAFPALALPAGLYDVLLEPAGPDAPVSLLAVDLTQPPPPVLATAAPALLTGTIRDDAGQAVAGVEVTAVPLATSALAGSAGAGARTQTASDGKFALEVTAGGAYELVIDGSAHGSGRVGMPVGAPAAGQTEPLGNIALPPVALATGRLVMSDSGVGAAGITVQLLCAACSAPGDGPLAEAISDAFGDFTLRIPAAR